MQAYIKAISYYLPQQQLNNADLAARFPEWSAEKIAEKVGIHTRHIAAADEFASDLAVNAAQKLFEEHQIDKACVDFILYCTQSPDHFLPTTACVIQNRLGLSKHIGAVDINQGCSGYVYGLAMAKGLIVAGVAKNILLLTAETYSKFIHPADKGNLTIFGDAAAATLVSTDGFARIDEFELGTDGNGAHNLIVKNGAVKYPAKSSALTDNNFIADDYLYMDGAEIFNFTISEIPQLIEKVLTKNVTAFEAIEQFVLHQANSFMLEHLRKKMKIDQTRFYNNIKETGNTVSSTIPIALYNLYNPHQPVKNSKWLLAGFGVGYSWGATILSFN